MGREIGLCPQIAAPAAHVHILSGVDRSELRLRAKRPCERSGLAGQTGETAPVDRLIVDDLTDRVVKALHVQEAAELKRGCPAKRNDRPVEKSEEHTSELQSLMRTSYAVL